MPDYSVTGSSQDQMSLSNSAAFIISMMQSPEPWSGQSCAKSLRQGADESREDIRQGPSLALAPDLPLAPAPSLLRIQALGLSVMRQTFCICRANQKGQFLSDRERLGIEQKLEGFSILKVTEDAYSLLDDARRLGTKVAARWASHKASQDKVKHLCFTLEQLRELRELQMELQIRHQEVWELSELVGEIQKRLESEPGAFSGATPIRLLPESPTHQLLEWLPVKVDGSVKEIPYCYSGIQFWCEIFQPDDGIDSISVMLCESLEDVASIAELDEVTRGISAQDEAHQRRLVDSQKRRDGKR